MNTLKIIAAGLVVGVFFAASGYSHEERTAPPGAVDEHTALMVKQHEYMHSLQAEWDKAKTAVKQKNPGKAFPPAAKMEFDSTNLDKFMLHKHPERRGEFLMKAAAFQKLIKDFKEHAERGDNAYLKKTVPKIESACKGCHKTFN